MISLLYKQLIKLNYKWHLLIALLLRILLIGYGTYHDSTVGVPYTDVDYKVFTDASRHILENRSPYNRHTYRYTPLVALLLIPNVLLHGCFGKLLFSFVDLLVGVLIRLIVKNSIKEFDCYKEKIELKGSCESKQLKLTESKSTNYETQNIRNRQRKKSKNSERQLKKSINVKNALETAADDSMMLWLYNPMTIAIATRGNCDAIAALLVLLTLYLLQCKRKYFAAGICHGISVHLRLYPIVYSLALFMYLSKYSVYTSDKRKSKSFEITDLKQIKNLGNKLVKNSNNSAATLDKCIQERKTIFKKHYLTYIIPNFEQFKLISGCILSLFLLTGGFYLLYGYKFLYETYIYHFTRKDTRHNFSIYFYLQYLTAGVYIGVWQKVLIVLPQLVLLLVLSIRYGLNKLTLNFSILTQTIVMVTYNTVLTSQYFIWIAAVLPLCVWQIRMTRKTAIFLIFIWFAAQLAWLLPAYFLEFHGQNTFLFVWIQSVSFFCANIAILGRLIMYFMPVQN